MECIEIASDVCLLYFIDEPLAVKNSRSLELWSDFLNAGFIDRFKGF